MSLSSALHSAAACRPISRYLPPSFSPQVQCEDEKVVALQTPRNMSGVFTRRHTVFTAAMLLPRVNQFSYGNPSASAAEWTTHHYVGRALAHSARTGHQSLLINNGRLSPFGGVFIAAVASLGGASAVPLQGFFSVSRGHDERRDENKSLLLCATLEGSSPTHSVVPGLRPSHRHARRPPLRSPRPLPSLLPSPSLTGPHPASGVRYQPFSGAQRLLTDGDPRSTTSWVRHRAVTTLGHLPGH